MDPIDDITQQILDGTLYIEPMTNLPVPDGMCTNGDCLPTSTTSEIILDTIKLAE
jgi:hypothetical protein